MRATTTISTLLSASVYLAPALALSLLPHQELDPRHEGKQSVDTLAVIDLNEFSDGLTKRTPITYCIQGTAEAGVCIAVTSFLLTLALGIASQVKSDSKANDCTEHTGAIDGVHWSVYAEGRNCDTTAQLDTIAGAIAVYLRKQNSSVCGTHCIRMDHGGTWNGYVTLAPAGQNIDNFYCGRAYTFGQCGSGGNGDIN